jgi:hypothetical protein
MIQSIETDKKCSRNLDNETHSSEIGWIGNEEEGIRNNDKVILMGENEGRRGMRKKRDPHYTHHGASSQNL